MKTVPPSIDIRKIESLAVRSMAAKAAQLISIPGGPGWEEVHDVFYGKKKIQIPLRRVTSSLSYSQTQVFILLRFFQSQHFSSGDTSPADRVHKFFQFDLEHNSFVEPVAILGARFVFNFIFLHAEGERSDASAMWVRHVLTIRAATV